MALKGKVAYIDLSLGEVNTASIPIELRKHYIGGRGLDSYLLYNHLDGKVEPLGPDSVVVVSAGLLGGMVAPAPSRTHITFKSPLTGYLGGANIGGFFAPELRFAGFDHIVITGKSPKPAYVFVNNGSVKIRDAAPIWGKTAPEAQEILRKELDDGDIQTICIGPAGEKSVRFASVVTRHQSESGRTGAGAVFGSKNLKAIVARGTQGIAVKSPKEALEYDRKVTHSICSSEFGRKMQRWGSAFLYDDIGVSSSGRKSNLQITENIDKYSLGMDGCFGCQLHCRHRYIIEEGPYAGVYTQGPGYGSQRAWGSAVGCTSMNTILVGNYLANAYGLDTCEAGSLISWAMKLYEVGILTDQDTGGLRLRFGDDGAVIEMIHRICRREGLGDILAEGGLRAVQKLAEGSEKYLGRVKGLSNLHLDQDPTPERLIAIATATRASDHFRSRPSLDLELPESRPTSMYGEPYAYDGPLPSVSWRVFWHELCSMAADMLGICEFNTVLASAGAPGFEEFSKLVYLNTGIELSAGEIWDCANRGYALERLFNVREGYTREDDWLEESYLDEANSSSVLSRQKFEAMIDEYYRIHGWDTDGVPTQETLKRLGLDSEPSHRV